MPFYASYTYIEMLEQLKGNVRYKLTRHGRFGLHPKTMLLIISLVFSEGRKQTTFILFFFFSLTRPRYCKKQQHITFSPNVSVKDKMMHGFEVFHRFPAGCKPPDANFRVFLEFLIGQGQKSMSSTDWKIGTRRVRSATLTSYWTASKQTAMP